MTNPLSPGALHDLQVTRGDNNLDTCFQYCVLDADTDKILNIKIYDKVLDLAGRDYFHTVGSRIPEILGSKR